VKDLSAVPLLFFKNIKFPHQAKSWKDDVNGQWDFGNKFLFHSGNPAYKMIFWARIPMILILILLAFYVFRWARELFGNKTALLALFLVSFSPTLIAHARLVTTDVGAAAGMFIGAYYFIRFLKEPSRKNIILSGIAFGLAELAKFSTILLFPFFGLLIIFWAYAKSSNFKSFLKIFWKYLLLTIVVTLIAYTIVWAFYLYHTWNYPPERQVRDTKLILESFPSRLLADALIWMADKPIIRAISYYLLGVFMVIQRASGGNTTYFLGQVSAAGWKIFFPIVYIIKQPLTFIILLIASILYAAWSIKKPLWEKPIKRFKSWIGLHFPEFAMLLAIAIYWAVSLKSNLNIGVRHLIPVFPFTILLVSAATIKWLKPPLLLPKKILLSGLLIWQAISVISVCPHFLAYFNELVGGPNNGYIYTVDSNLDWGQDLKRLNQWLEKNKINKIYVDYFGGSDTKYYLGDKFLPWWGTRDPKELPQGSYLAVSATFLQGGRGEPVSGFNGETGYYNWLYQYHPVAKIGYSIFVYHIN
ncbi:MAG TPA: glycosyltransferase family 39 protein, partial [Candidatus Parcubacteria bacterium]|nr:glycosyltransferase family 39 protein [Candidatus Parcubacteria bacterium]